MFLNKRTIFNLVTEKPYYYRHLIAVMSKIAQKKYEPDRKEIANQIKTGSGSEGLFDMDRFGSTRVLQREL